MACAPHNNKKGGFITFENSHNAPIDTVTRGGLGQGHPSANIGQNIQNGAIGKKGRR